MKQFITQSFSVLAVTPLLWLKQLIASKSLMEQYKSIIDDSVIVSKSDARGIITYANSEFCKISGYELEELLGRPHSIIRHPDVDKEVFKEMWTTIKNGKKWRGVVKNLSKDGKVYWVKAVINPLFNDKGEIVEYIAVRDDITEMMEMKEHLQQKLNVTSENLMEMFNLAQDYEKAIEESNLLTRTDLDGVITYANESFYDITGFAESEIIGKTHAVFHHAKTPKEQIENIWNTIQKGDAYKGIIRNKTRDGKDIWLNTTITPIQGSDSKPREYMAIRHDVTSLVELQREFERTQRDMLYRLGEIGETRNKETGSHVKRVAEYSKVLANLAGLSQEQTKMLYMASPMHDIGKIGISDAILLKPGKLDADEWESMKSHTLIGYNLLRTSASPALKAAAIISEQHHEKYDGSGYPHGLKEEEIHIFSRITAIADVFDALGSDRPYKKAWTLGEIFKFFEEESGRHFDPKLTDIFLNNRDMFVAIKDMYRD